MIIQICIGSSCHLKGSSDILQLLQTSIADAKLEDDIVLTGSFCIGKCNREGVTVQVDGDICTGITRENYHAFWKNHVLSAL